MKIVLIVLAFLTLAGIVAFFVLGFMSQSGEARGIVEARLTKCPDKPNCICTEFESDVSHYIEPIVFTQANTSEVLAKLKNNILDMGGSIEAENGNYLAATFTSSLFKFVDDLEVRIDMDQKLIHIRSASRVGYSDRGINLKRIEQLKKLYHG